MRHPVPALVDDWLFHHLSQMGGWAGWMLKKVNIQNDILLPVRGRLQK